MWDLDLEQVGLFLDVVLRTSAIVAIPWLSIRYLMDLATRRRERAAQVYGAIDQSFRHTLELSMAYPRLAAWEAEHPDGQLTLTADERYQQWQLFDIVTSNFEITYLTYRDLRGNRRFREHWKAWRNLLLQYCRKPSYRHWLETFGLRGSDRGTVFDPDFEAELQAVYKEAQGP